MVLTILDAMAEIKQMSILLDQVEDKTLLTIKIFNKNKPFSRYLVDKLTNKYKIDLDTKNINTYLTLLLLKHYNFEVNFICDNYFIEISLTILSG